MTDEEQMRIFSKNINYFIAQSGKTQKEIAKALGYNATTFNTWCVGKVLPRAGRVQKIADYFGISKSDLLDDKAYLTGKVETRGIIINVLGRVAAGIPIEAIEEVIDTEEIPLEMAATGSFFGLRIHGDSMEPKISDGDTVIVRQQEDAETGDIVIALINGDEGVCKRLRKYRDGIELISSNPSYPAMFFSNEDIDNKPVRIIGKVVELRAKF